MLRIQKKRPGASRASSERGTVFLPVILHDQVVDEAVGFVDMVEGAIAQPSDRRIIFFAGNIVVRFVEQFLSPVKAASAVHVGVDRRMVVKVLTVINRGMLDFPNRFIDLVDGVLLFPVHVPSGRQLAEVSARMPQVGERMQVGRMPSRLVSKSQSGADSKEKHEYSATSYSFHSLLLALRQKTTGRLNPELEI